MELAAGRRRSLMGFFKAICMPISRMITPPMSITQSVLRSRKSLMKVTDSSAMVA